MPELEPGPRKSKKRDKIRRTAAVAAEAGAAVVSGGSSTIASAVKVGSKTAAKSAVKSAAHSRVEQKLGKTFPPPTRTGAHRGGSNKKFDTFTVDGVIVQQPRKASPGTQKAHTRSSYVPTGSR